MEKKHFLEKVSKLFLKYGAKTLTMDDIAKEFSISKKTLYQQYKNKEELLEEVLKFQLEDSIEKLTIHIESKDTNAIDKFLMRKEKLSEITEMKDTFFTRQLKKYYINLYNENALRMTDAVSKLFIKNIEKGRKEGWYRTDFDEKLYIDHFFLLMMAFDDSVLLEKKEKEEGLTADKHADQIINFFLNAIVNEKGREYLNKFKI